MFRFDLESGSKGDWFPFQGSKINGTDEKGEPKIEYLEQEKDAGRVKIRLADSEQMERIHAQTRKKIYEYVHNPKTRSMERVSSIEQTPEQEKKERELIWDYAIEDWEGILDTKGQPIPCTPENKMKLMNVPIFARFISRCLQLLSEKTDKAELEKN